MGMLLDAVIRGVLELRPRYDSCGFQRALEAFCDAARELHVYKTFHLPCK